MKILLLILLPLTGFSQSVTKYQMVLTPSVENEVLIMKSGEIEEISTFVYFGKGQLEISNTTVNETIYLDRSLNKRMFLGRTKKGDVAVVELIYMRNLEGKKMAVLRISLDREYFLFPDKPYIK